MAPVAKLAIVKKVIEDFANQCPHQSVLEWVQLIKARTFAEVAASPRENDGQGPLDRRPVSTRTKELRVADNSLSEEEVASEIDQIERVQRQLNRRKKRRNEANWNLQYRQLVLDHAFASQASKSK